MLLGFVTLFAGGFGPVPEGPNVVSAGAVAVNQATPFPVTTVDCFGRELTFTEAPSRIVTLDGSAVEFLLRLGLGDRIVGTGFPLAPDEIPADLADAMAAVPVLGETDVFTSLSTEQIAAAQPDLILTTYPFMLDSTFDQRTPSDVLGPGVQAVTACNGAPGASRDGIEPTYQFIDQLGLIFGVQDRSDGLVAEMRDRQAALTAAIPAGASPRVMLVSGIPDGDSPIRAWGGASFPNGIVTLAGGTNAFGDVAEDFLTPSAEDIAARDPEFLLIFAQDPPGNEEVAATLRADPVLGETTAARDGRFIILPGALTSGPSMRNLASVGQLVAALYGAPVSQLTMSVDERARRTARVMECDGYDRAASSEAVAPSGAADPR